MKYYTGIGSRGVPQDVMVEITSIASALAEKGYVLRSGGANGCDTAFAHGANDSVIYLPWDGYNDIYADGSEGIVVPDMIDAAQYEEAALTIRMLHRAYNKLSSGGRKLHQRNYYQVLGHTHCSPESEFVVYWAPVDKNGVQGGTATAVLLAQRNRIPTYNLKNHFERREFFEFLYSL